VVPARPGIRRGRVERRSLTASAAALLLAQFPSAAQTAFEPPEAPPSERFAPIWERSPFTLKTLATGPVASGPSFADSFALAGLSDVGGKVTVYLKNKASGSYLTLTDSDPNPGEDHGIAFVSVLDDTDPRKVRVRLRKGAEVAEVGYAQDQFQTAGSAPAVPPGASSSALGRPAGTPNALPAPSAQPGTPPQPSRRRIILPQAGPPQASARPFPEPVRTALLEPNHAPSPSIPSALRALPSP